MSAVVVRPLRSSLSPLLKGSEPHWVLLWILLAGCRRSGFALWACFRDAPISIADEKDYAGVGADAGPNRRVRLRRGGLPTSIRPPLFPRAWFCRGLLA